MCRITNEWSLTAVPAPWQGFCGTCKDNAIGQGLSALKVKAFTQVDVSPHLRRGDLTCYWPQIEATLKEIHEKEALNAIFILSCQIIPNWVCTFKNWMEYDRQLMVCNITSSPALPVEGPNSHTDMSPPCWLEDFFCSQVEYARDFVVSHLLQTGKIDGEKFKPSPSGLNLPC